MRLPVLAGVGLLCVTIIGVVPGSAWGQKRQPSYSVHPFCVQKVVQMWDLHSESSKGQLAVAECNRRFRRYEVKIPEADWLFADGPEADVPRPYFGYRVVGPLNSKVTLVEVSENGGGTGIFSSLAFIQGWPKETPSRGARLTTVGIVEGGDRCQGTLTDTTILSPTTLRISWLVTPASFLVAGPDFSIRETAKGRYALGKLQDSDRLDYPPTRDGALSDYPSDCFGAATIEFDLASGAARLIEVTVDTSASPDTGQNQQCFNRLIREVGIGPSVSFSAEQHLAFAQRYERECSRS